MTAPRRRTPWCPHGLPEHDPRAVHDEIAADALRDEVVPAKPSRPGCEPVPFDDTQIEKHRAAERIRAQKRRARKRAQDAHGGPLG